MSSYEVRLSRTAAKTFGRLPDDNRARIRQALRRLAADAATPGRIEGKSVKSTHGTDDSFHRLRVGDHRVLHDVITEDRVVLVLGIIDRRDLERWLRQR